MAKYPTQTPTAVAPGAFIAVGHVLHNGDLYEAGAGIEGLSEAEAATLLEAGAIALVAADPAPAA